MIFILLLIIMSPFIGMSLKKMKDFSELKKIISNKIEYKNIDFSDLFSGLHLILNILVIVLIIQRKDITVLILISLFADLFRGFSMLYSEDKKAFKLGLNRIYKIFKYGFIILLFIPVYKFLNGTFLLCDISEKFMIGSVPLFFSAFFIASMVKLDFLDEFYNEFFHVSKISATFLILGRQFESVVVLLLLSLFYIKFSIFAFIISFLLLFIVYNFAKKLYKFNFLYMVSVFLGFLNILYLIFLKS